MNRSNPKTDGSHTFLVEIEVTAPNRDAALKRLHQTLSESSFDGYRIVTNNSDPSADKEATKSAASLVQPVSASSSPPKKNASKPSAPDPLENRIRTYIESNKLIRISVNKGRGVKLSIPCRALSYDADKQLMTVYHVDEKQVYTVGLNEIDDFLD